jgi:hypothetical protein
LQQTTVQHIPISSPSTIYNLVQPVVTDVEKSKQNISQAASSVTSASTFQPFSQFSVPPPQISTQGNFQPLTTHASAQGQHRIFHPQAIDTKQQPSTPTTPTLHIPKFDPHMPPPPIPTSRVSNILASTSTFDTQTQQTVTVTNPLGSGTGFSTGIKSFTSKI